MRERNQREEEKREGGGKREKNQTADVQVPLCCRSHCGDPGKQRADLTGAIRCWTVRAGSTCVCCRRSHPSGDGPNRLRPVFDQAHAGRDGSWLLSPSTNVSGLARLRPVRPVYSVSTDKRLRWLHAMAGRPAGQRRVAGMLCEWSPVSNDLECSRAASA
jgi:hypothetical protein